LEFLDKVTSYVDSGDSVDVIFLDFVKASDKVSHNKLIQKIKAHGIEGKLLCWIANWLHNRVQRVGVRGVLSDWFCVEWGTARLSTGSSTISYIHKRPGLWDK